MSNKDNLLNENTIKRFMRLSSLNDFTDRFLDKVEESRRFKKRPRLKSATARKVSLKKMLRILTM